MGTPTAETKRPGTSFAHEGSAERTQGPRPQLVELFNDRSSDIVSMSLESRTRRSIRTFGKRVTTFGVAIEVKFPLDDQTPAVVSGLGLYHFPSEHISEARDWVDKNSADPSGIPLVERIDHRKVEPLLQRAETVLDEGISDLT